MLSVLHRRQIREPMVWPYHEISTLHFTHAGAIPACPLPLLLRLPLSHLVACVRASCLLTLISMFFSPPNTRVQNMRAWCSQRSAQQSGSSALSLQSSLSYVSMRSSLSIHLSIHPSILPALPLPRLLPVCGCMLDLFLVNATGCRKLWPPCIHSDLGCGVYALGFRVLCCEVP